MAHSNLYPRAHSVNEAPGSDRRVNYYEYIESDAWKAKRAEAILRAGHKCQLCSDRRQMPGAKGVAR